MPVAGKAPIAVVAGRSPKLRPGLRPADPCNIQHAELLETVKKNCGGPPPERIRPEECSGGRRQNREGAAMDSHKPRSAASSEMLLDAVEAIYGHAADPRYFDQLPEVLAPVLEADSVNIWCMDTNLEPAVVSNFGLSEIGVQDYLGNWVHEDPLLTAALQSYASQTTTPEGLFGQREYRRLPVFEGFYEPYDIVRQMARFDMVLPGWLAGLSFQRRSGGSPIDEQDQQRFEILAHHLRRAWFISLQMGLLKARSESVESILSKSRLATWLLDGHRRVHAWNPAAEDVASAPGSGVVNTQGTLRFSDPELDASFRESLRYLGRNPHTPADLPLPVAGRHDFVWAAILPLEHDHHGTGQVGTLYLLVIARAGTDNNVDWRLLHERLPISRTEADILTRLMRSEDPLSIAQARGSKLETIRGYEKSLRTKLDCHSRAELVAQGWRTIAVIPNIRATKP